MDSEVNVAYRLWITGLALALLVFNLQAAEKYTLDQVLAQMGAAGRNFRSLEASIERTKVTVLVNDKALDSGKVYFVRNGQQSRLKLDILKPEVQRLLVEKQVAQLYFPKIKQVQQFNLGKDRDKAEFLLVGFGQSNEDIRKYYTASLAGEETVNGVRTSVLDLKPKAAQAAAMFASIRLWMDQQRWIPVQTKLTEASGDYLLINFTGIKLNSNIANSVFDLKLPKDVQRVIM